MAVYKVNGVNNASQGTLELSEHHVYGSSRLGTIKRSLDADQPKYTPESISNLGNAYLINFTRGNKLFEINNHLGNVMATVSDRVLPEAVTGTPTAVRGYTADIVTASDYYPFGMVSRAFNSPSINYRYGFNGKEVDNEMFGIGNELDYGMRVYDPRVGRFLSVDPLTSTYPELTPYQFASNTPIQGTDLDGLEISYHYDDPRFGMVIMPAGDNLARQIPPEHLKFIPQAKNKRSQGIMGENASLVLDFVPVAGTVKGGIEGVVGYDAAGNELSGWERAQGVVPYLRPLRKINKVMKAADKADDAKDLSKAVNKVDDVVSNEKALVQTVGDTKTGRGKNHLKHDDEATGDHFTFKQDDFGDVYKYQEFKVNPKNPKGFQPGKRFDGGKPDGSPGTPHSGVPTPHMQDKPKGKARKPEPNEIPDNKRFKE